MSAAGEREYLGLAIMVWFSLAAIVYVAVRLVLGKPLLRRATKRSGSRGSWLR